MTAATQSPALAIEVTRTSVDEDGDRFVEGCFPDLPGWTFDALIAPDLDWSSDFYAAHSATQVLEATLYEDGVRYYSCPQSDYDGDGVYLDTSHGAMLYAIDLQFGPSLEERTAAEDARTAEENQIFEALSAFLETHHPTASSDAIADAAERLRQAHR